VKSKKTLKMKSDWGEAVVLGIWDRLPFVD
jgi:hypothetical protein